jgi:NAD(P)-dependent dehydrogenase (short-subunit alcohol dehydrogenase family)
MRKGKSGLIGFTRSAANATASDGITVNVIAPIPIETERGE